MQDGAVRGVGVEQGAFNALGVQEGAFRMAGLGAAPGAFQMQGTGLEQGAVTVSGLGAAPGAFQVLLFVNILGLNLIYFIKWVSWLYEEKRVVVVVYYSMIS